MVIAVLSVPALSLVLGEIVVVEKGELGRDSLLIVSKYGISLSVAG